MSMCPLGIDYPCDECNMCGQKQENVSEEKMEEFVVNTYDDASGESECAECRLDWMWESAEKKENNPSKE